MPDCHWTSLNFFNLSADQSLPTAARHRPCAESLPQDRASLIGSATCWLMSTKNGNALHTCIFVAGDIVYTKNGGKSLQFHQIRWRCCRHSGVNDVAGDEDAVCRALPFFVDISQQSPSR